MNALLITLAIIAYEPRPTAAGIVALAAMSPQSVQVEAKPAPEPEPEKKPPVVQCWIFTMDNCPHCVTQKRIIDRELLPQGWKTSDFRYVDRDDDNELTRKFKVKLWPQVVIVRDGEEAKRFKPGTVRAAYLAAQFNEIRAGVKCMVPEEEPPVESVDDSSYFGRGRRFR